MFRTVSNPQSAPVTTEVRSLPVSYEQAPQVIKNTVTESSPVTTTYISQPTTTQYISSQPQVIRQQYTPAPVVTSYASGSVFAPNVYRPKRVFRFAKPDYNWQGPVQGSEAQGATQLVRQGGYVSNQYLAPTTVNTVRTVQP